MCCLWCCFYNLNRLVSQEKAPSVQIMSNYCHLLSFYVKLHSELKSKQCQILFHVSFIVFLCQYQSLRRRRKKRITMMTCGCLLLLLFLILLSFFFFSASV